MLESCLNKNMSIQKEMLYAGMKLSQIVLRTISLKVKSHSFKCEFVAWLSQIIETKREGNY